MHFFFLDSVRDCTSFSEEPQDQTVVQNETAQFPCSVDCAIPYNTTWIYNSPSGISMLIANASQLFVSNSKYSLSTITETLVVHNVSYEDRGVYICSTSSDIATLTSAAMLTVEGKSESLQYPVYALSVTFPSNPFSSTYSTSNRKLLYC